MYKQLHVLQYMAHNVAFATEMNSVAPINFYLHVYSCMYVALERYNRRIKSHK